MIMPNERTVTLKLSRRDVTKVLLAVSFCSAEEGGSWLKLHEELRRQLDAYDARWILYGTDD